MRKFWILTLIILVTASIMLFGGCARLAPFNQYSFNETARLKKESIAMLKKSNRSYHLSARKPDDLLESIQRAYQDAHLRALNAESMRLWENILDTNQLSVAGALHRWKKNDTLSQPERDLFQNNIAQDFDGISKLEGNKGR